MKGTKGNKFGVAIKDKDMRQRAYKSFCEHRAKGKSIKSWWFEEDGFSCIWETLMKYIKDTNEFDPMMLKRAEAQGYYLWEDFTEQSAMGKKRCNTQSLQLIMRNKFGWDKEVQAKAVPNDTTLTELIQSLKLPKEDNASQS